jgi:hypothetical protein
MAPLFADELTSYLRSNSMIAQTLTDATEKAL